MAKRIVNKLLHYPTICLKQQASCADGHRYAEVVRDLFGLDGKGEQR
jgi:glutamyl-tRNA reductase